MKAALVLGVAVALTACGKSAGDRDRTPAAAPTPMVRNGWASVWSDAPATIALLNGMGFRLSPYTARGSVHEATAMPTPMADPSVKPVNMAGLTVTGDAKTVSSLRFALDIVNLTASPFAKDQFARWVTRPMSAMGVDGVEPVTRAIRAETETTGSLNGAEYQVTRETINGGRRLVVTFTRPAAMAGTSEPRKQ